MIPKVHQDAPNIMKRYTCSTCGTKLQKEGPFRGAAEEKWNFCPICGEDIQWDKAEDPVWAELSCEVCGEKLVYEGVCGYQTTGAFVGGKKCRSCQIQHCLSTNCFACKDGEYPTCKHQTLKNDALKRWEKTYD